MEKPITVETLENFTKTNRLSKDLASHYLNIYVSPNVDWTSAINKKYNFISRKNTHLTPEEIGEKMKTILCATILMPAYYPSVRESLKSREPDYLLHAVDKFDQFGNKQWVEELHKVVTKDIEIQKFRTQIMSIGIISQIEYQPYYRQAFNWLIERAEKNGDVNDNNRENVKTSMRHIVVRYGGMAISNLFSRHTDVVNTIVNWRTGYFIERALFRIYSPEEIKKIKQIELAESPQRLVQKINA